MHRSKSGPLMTANGMVRPCSRPANDKLARGAKTTCVVACMAAWDHGKLNGSFEQDGEVQALYWEATGFDQSQGKTMR